MTMRQVREVLGVVRETCAVVALDIAAHDLGLDLAERYRLSIYDAMVVAAASRAGCATLCSEDLQNGQRLGGLTVKNPFRPY
jgi:predicted nucleic acid-binding protein